MNVKEIMQKWLKENGYDGLIADSWVGCGCEIDDLVACDSSCDQCEPAHKVPCPGPADCENGGGCEWHMAAGKREEKKDDSNQADNG